MPCWYYDRRELDEMNHHGLDPKVIARYRKEGPRFILDCGAKMGLRYETCATGVVYFHRFYLFKSFRDFNRHVTAACCLFLAGKVEETPKKCKDIIKIARSMLTDQQFAVFGEDPREEVMTMERILLQTIKFDLQVEHPYIYLLQFAKVLKGNDETNRDRDKIQAMVQMAWTFINDSMCTLLCLQWEPDILAVALMYLASRLKTFEITEWAGKTPNTKGKWWSHLVEDITFELLEDICHQVLDLYSNPAQNREESPPPPPPPKHPPAGPTHKRSRSNTPIEAPEGHSRDRGAPPPSKMIRHESARSKSPSPSPSKPDKNRQARHAPPIHGTGTPVKTRPGGPGTPPTQPPAHPGVKAVHSGSVSTIARPDGQQYNPYMSSAMYGSSFMSGEGAQSIQSLMSGGSQGGSGPGTPVPPSGPPPSGPYGQPPVPPSNYSQPPHSYQQAPPYQSYQQAPPQTAPYQPPPAGPAPPYPPQSYQQPPPSQQPPPTQQPPPQQPPPPGYSQYQYHSYTSQPPSQNPPYPPPPQPGYQPPPGPPQQYAQYPPSGAAPPGAQYNYQQQPPSYQQQPQQYKGGPPPSGSFPVRGPPGGPVPPTTGLPVRITPRR